MQAGFEKISIPKDRRLDSTTLASHPQLQALNTEPLTPETPKRKVTEPTTWGTGMAPFQRGLGAPGLQGGLGPFENFGLGGGPKKQGEALCPAS